MLDKKSMREALLEELMDKMLDYANGKKSSPEEEATESEMLSKDGEDSLLGEEEKPETEIKIDKIDEKPKFKVGDVEMEDESIEDILKRKGLKK